ncbi:hypothetical protein ACQVP2_14795 [Methylobacterium aquaticum]|jgi:hypothetical protein|uniref:hypothetical protein n=1 Tax=Methylobacterium aquaticum TaxID=270351 RepID=UPI001933AFE6|nr:hypothetical protein [Methylobacterium aquaticum]QRE78123.1 hypothetical protein F1D61_32320 [Methylobacterium aquaticum]QRE78219.1 hypothetical protein F1D61_32910 [Methylobacterium aquaticum]
MAIEPIITSAASAAQRGEAERTGMSWFVRGFKAWRATTEAFRDRDDIVASALAAGTAAIRARAEAGFDAAT